MINFQGFVLSICLDMKRCQIKIGINVSGSVCQKVLLRFFFVCQQDEENFLNLEFFSGIY